jgi:putative membrane protein
MVGGDMWPGFDMNGFWVMGIVSGVIGLVIMLGLIVLIILGIRWLLRQDRYSGPGAPAPDDALEVLRRRFASGEIDEAEYQARRKTLGG